MKRIAILMLALCTFAIGQGKKAPIPWFIRGGSGGVTSAQLATAIDTSTYPTSLDTALGLLMLNSTRDSIIYSGFRTNASRDTIWAINGSIVYPSGDGWVYKYTTVDTTRAQTSAASLILYELTHSLSATSLYEFEAAGLITTSNASNTTGPHSLVTCGSTPTRIGGIAEFPGNGSGAGLIFADAQANATAATANTDTAKIASAVAGTAPLRFMYRGAVLTNGATDLRLFLYASPTGTNTITVYKGFYFRVRKLY